MLPVILIGIDSLVVTVLSVLLEMNWCLSLCVCLRALWAVPLVVSVVTILLWILLSGCGVSGRRLMIWMKMMRPVLTLTGLSTV